VSVRGTFAPEDLASPHPLATLLPGLYQDDELVIRFTEALDTVLAPVTSVLDSSDAYVDPRLAPLDFVTWLAQWVGVELDASWPQERQRALVARAAELYAWRGTVRGLAALIAITTGIEPEILETGGVGWTAEPPPSGGLPGSPSAALVVRLRLPAGSAGAAADAIDVDRLDRLVAQSKPAHIPHRVEVV
jgi:phage tail-like protein